uniref:Uncharacterized protein n=1 Tax=Cacopsylla melanoneura TaxID=428564 RepID=A0A8D8R9P7_9HEMI
MNHWQRSLNKGPFYRRFELGFISLKSKDPNVVSSYCTYLVPNYTSLVYFPLCLQFIESQAVQIANRKKNTSTSLYLSKCGLIIMLHLSSLCLSLQFESLTHQ